MSVPSKRRRTSPSTYISINSQSEEDTVRQTTPKRASYLSPTKASLARSNPNLLPKIVDAQARRESSPHRRQSLRDAVLSGRNEDVGKSSTRTDTEQLVNPGVQNTEVQTARLASGELTSDETKVIEQPPKEDGSYRNVFRSPLKPRQSLVYTPRQYRSITPVKAQNIVPTLVHSSSKSGTLERRDQDTEGELPPTPVELGSDHRPHRPRGLASSSPGGDGRRRVRTQDGTVTSSPLKPRAAPLESSKAPDHMEIASGLGGEEEEQQQQQEEQEENDLGSADNEISKGARSDILSETAEGVNLLSEEELYLPENVQTSNSNNKLKALQDQLQMLKAECNDLETLSTKISKSNIQALDWASLDDSFELLLSSLCRTIDPLYPPLESHELFRKNPTKFMTLFSPGNLIMSYQTWEKKVKGARKFIYETTLAAPKPWPLETFNLTFETTFDHESDTIEHIRFKRVGNATLNEELEKWINAQLDSPVMRCDLSTIVTGVGRYLEADIARAQILKCLSECFPCMDPILVAGGVYQTTSEARTEPRKGVTAADEALSLLPFLGKPQMTFSEASSQTRHKTRRSASSASVREVMLVYEIRLNWIGNPSKTASIVTSGFTDEASQHASKMFKEIEHVKGIVPAFESVWEVLGLEHTAQHDNGPDAAETKSKGKGRPKKSAARRMTEFN